MKPYFLTSGKSLLHIFIVICMLFSGVNQAAKASNLVNHDYSAHWANEIIEAWIQEGLIEGFPDGSFRPDQPITRAELSSFANRAFGFTQETAISFQDVDAADWYASDIKRAVAAGYIHGYTDSTVRPLNEVTRQEAAAMIQRILDLDPKPASADFFKDRNTIAHWSRGAVGAVLLEGIIAGYPDGRFMPDQALTRAEAIVILDKARTIWAASQDIVLDDVGQTFGPDRGGKDQIKGNIIVGAPDITLQHLVIDGDLIIEESVGEGDITLHEIEVRGTVQVHGGGKDSIHIQDSTVIRLVIEKEAGVVRIVATGATMITETVMYSPALLEETDQLLGEGFQNVVLYGSEMDINIIRAIIDRLHITSESTEVVIYLEKDAKILELINEGDASVIQVGGLVWGGIPAPSPDPEREPEPEPEPTVTAVTYTPESLTLTELGGKAQIQLTAEWSDDTTSDITAEAMWSSEDASVAVVSGGEVTATEAGTTFIVAEYETYEVRVPVTVELEPEITAVTFSPDSLSFVELGEKANILLTAEWSDDTTSDITAEATWSSEDASVAVVSGGEVTATGAGTTFIVAEYDSFEVRVPVTVITAAAYARITSEAYATVVGEELSVTMAVYRSDGNVDTDFDGEKMITISGYTFAPIGTAGSYGGTPLTEASTTVTIEFTDGVASADLILHHAELQSIAILIEETKDGPHVLEIIGIPGKVSKLEWIQQPSLVVAADEVFDEQPMLLVVDLYLNPMDNLNEGMVTASVTDPEYRLAGTTSVPVADGKAVFTDLSITTFGPGGEVTLQFTTDIAGISDVVESDPVEVQKRFSAGDGSEEAPYVIVGVSQLAKMNEDLSAHYILEADIELSNDLGFYPDASGWVSIGTDDDPFTGTFDGNGHTISDLRISRDAPGQGLFGVVDGGRITNVHLSSVEIWSDTRNNAGAIVGQLKDGEVSHVSATGIVVGNDNIGGIIGYNLGTVSHASFISTDASHKVQGDSQVGGLIGMNYGRVTNTFTDVKVFGNGEAGGHTGFNVGEIIQSAAAGNVEAPLDYVGGLVGYLAVDSIVKDAYATGSVSGRDYVGGLIGWMSGTVTNTYASGSVSGSNDESGGLIGHASGIDITSSYYLQNPNNGAGTQKSEAEMKQRVTYAGWVFEGESEDAVWWIEEGVSFPTLIGF